MADSAVPRVLFIDDAEDMTSLCKIVLQPFHYAIASAASGTQGIELARALKPHVIFLDMRLPDMSGIEVAKRLSSLFAGEGFKPVIYAFTNHEPGFFGERLEQVQVGIRRFVRKDDDLKRLAVALNEAISEVLEAPNFEPESLRLLLVEDNPTDVHIFSLLLQELSVPYYLKHVADGEAATDFVLKAVKGGQEPCPDLIFLDLNLPMKDGKAVLRELKSEPVCREIPIIVLTTSRDKEEARRCYDLHANCFLSKPTDLGEFEHMMRLIEGFWLKLVQLPRPAIQ